MNWRNWLALAATALIALGRAGAGAEHRQGRRDARANRPAADHRRPGAGASDGSRCTEVHAITDLSQVRAARACRRCALPGHALLLKWRRYEGGRESTARHRLGHMITITSSPPWPGPSSPRRSELDIVEFPVLLLDPADVDVLKMSRVSGSIQIGPRGALPCHPLHCREQLIALGVAAGPFQRRNRNRPSLLGGLSVEAEQGIRCGLQKSQSGDFTWLSTATLSPARKLN